MNIVDNLIPSKFVSNDESNGYVEREVLEMVFCLAGISFNDETCCMYNVFKNTNMELGYFTRVFCNKKDHQGIVAIPTISGNESKGRLKKGEC